MVHPHVRCHNLNISYLSCYRQLSFYFEFLKKIGKWVGCSFLLVYYYFRTGKLGYIGNRLVLRQVLCTGKEFNHYLLTHFSVGLLMIFCTLGCCYPCFNMFWPATVPLHVALVVWRRQVRISAKQHVTTKDFKIESYCFYFRCAT